MFIKYVAQYLYATYSEIRIAESIAVDPQCFVPFFTNKYLITN